MRGFRQISIFLPSILVVLCICSNTGIDGCGQVSKNPKDIRESAPWVAAIFQHNSDGEWIYLCGATLTSLFTVITTANCVQETFLNEWQQLNKRRHFNYSTLRVVAGLRSANYLDRDEHTQEAEVGMIREHQPYGASNSNGYQQLYQKRVNLAGVRLKSEFKSSSFVNPVCLVEVPNSPEELLTTQQGESAIIAGFDQIGSLLHVTEASSLQVFNMTVTGLVDCYTQYPNSYKNVVCTKLSSSGNGKSGSIPCDMEGHGMIVRPPNQSSLYLMGVYTSNSAKYESSSDYLTLSKSNATCGPHDSVFNTKYGEFYRWAISHFFCSEDLLQCQSDNCRPLTELCDGIANCKDRTDESDVVCFNQKVCKEDEFRCPYGACIAEEKVCDGNMDCTDNSDESNDTLCREADVRRNVSCPPIQTNTGVEATCVLPNYLGRRKVRCDGLIPVGTEVTYGCARYYILPDATSADAPSAAKCQRNGNWSQQIDMVCKPDCGISEVAKTPFVLGGQITNRGEHPWHVTIYRRPPHSNDTDAYNLICGGTLVSSTVILTAAHCLAKGNKKNALDPSLFKVLFAKQTSKYTDRDEATQGVKIKKFIMEEHYNPLSLDSDIALIILEEPVQITAYVRPACVPTPAESALTESQLNAANPFNGTSLGTVVGFGLDETKLVSQTLKKLDMPVIPTHVCKESLKAVLHDHIKYTWICAGHTNGSEVCQGDSGGGLIFSYDAYGGRKFYIQGVVSHGPDAIDKEQDPCASNNYKIFTKVILFSHWIHTYIADNEPDIYKPLPVPIRSS